MKETGFYKITQEYVDLIHKLGGIYRDNKERPIYCCVRDKYEPRIMWAVPASNFGNKPTRTIERIQKFCDFPYRDIRSCYYHIGTTDRPAFYKISNVLPLTEKYIAGEYTSKGKHLVLKDKAQISEIHRKLSHILFDEAKNPNKYEQRITDIKDYLLEELTDAGAVR